VLTRFEGTLPEIDAVRSVLTTFLGEHEQIPPMYSAVKQGGVPLYRLARRAKRSSARRARCIDAFVLRYDPPEAEVEVVCSPGTYVRVLAAEIGTRLGCGAFLQSLCRLRSGPFELAQALKPALLGAEGERGEIAARLMRPVAALGMSAMRLTAEDARRVLNGSALPQGGPRACAWRARRPSIPRGLLAILEVSGSPAAAPARAPPPCSARVTLVPRRRSQLPKSHENSRDSHRGPLDRRGTQTVRHPDSSGPRQDTGSPEVQVALLTERINELSDHFQAHAKTIIRAGCCGS
jgi:hypothetical protein